MLHHRQLLLSLAMVGIAISFTGCAMVQSVVGSGASTHEGGPSKTPEEAAQRWLDATADGDFAAVENLQTPVPGEPADLEPWVAALETPISNPKVVKTEPIDGGYTATVTYSLGEEEQSGTVAVQSTYSDGDELYLVQAKPPLMVEDLNANLEGLDGVDGSYHGPLSVINLPDAEPIVLDYWDEETTWALPLGRYEFEESSLDWAVAGSTAITLDVGLDDHSLTVGDGNLHLDQTAIDEALAAAEEFKETCPQVGPDEGAPCTIDYLTEAKLVMPDGTPEFDLAEGGVPSTIGIPVMPRKDNAEEGSAIQYFAWDKEHGQLIQSDEYMARLGIDS